MQKSIPAKRYYPVCLDIAGRNCLVVGGGQVGTRKVKTLVDCQAKVTVVSLSFTEELGLLANKGRITIKEKAYTAIDLEGVFLVIGATSDMALSRQISEDAESRHLLCNIADVPEACNFILPAVVRRGDLQVAISTSGKSPAYAKHLRRKLESQFGEEYAVFLLLMGEIRRALLAAEHEPEAHKNLFERLIRGGLLDMIREKQTTDINRLLQETLGEAFALNRLGIDL